MKNDNKDFKLNRRQLIRIAGGAAGALALPASTAARGRLVVPAVEGVTALKGTPNYEAWRQSMSWNYRPFRRYPDMIVQAESEDDVVAAINFAREQGMRITTRSGGHSWSGCFLRDGGVLLDLSRLQSITINKKRKQVVIGPGVIGRSLNTRLGEEGLAFPTAHCGMVPLSGFLLGGGLGINGTAWGGASAINIEAIDLVNANGEKLHASAEQNADYFWAARGAGPGLFFTVTRFYLKCYPLPGSIVTAFYTLPYEELLSLSSALEDLGPGIDPRVEMLGVVVPAPPDLRSKLKGKHKGHVALLSATAFVDSDAEAQKVLSPIASHPVMKRAIAVMPARPSNMEMLYQDNEGPFPQARARADNIFTSRLSEATAVLEKHMPAAPSPGNTPVILWRGKLDFPNAVYSSEGDFYFAGYAQWAKAEHDIANQEWLKNLFDELQPFASGHYINEFDRETRPLQTPKCFSAANWERLQKLRNRYDPDSVFQNFLGLPS